MLTALTALTGAVHHCGLRGTGGQTVPLGTHRITFSTFLFGPAAGAITAAVDALVMSLRLIPRLRTVHRVCIRCRHGRYRRVRYHAQLYFTLAGLDRYRPV